MTRGMRKVLGETVWMEKARSDVSDVDVLLSLSRIIALYPVSLTRGGCQEEKNC